ncbi:MAG: ABC transporter permease [Geminicoccaceae bacterium]
MSDLSLDSAKTRTRRPWTGDGWAWLSVAVAAVIALPLVSVASALLQPSPTTWTHLATTVLPAYVRSTIWLAVGVSLVTAVIGVSTAWLVVACRFPGRGLFAWALILPLAVPSYVLAYVYYDFLAFSGPVQTLLRDVTGLGPREYWFPRLSSIGGAVFVLAMALYPYVYLAARAAFLQQSGATIEASRTLGCTPLQAFWRIALPLARPGIVVGMSLAIMETLADFGAVSLLGVQTFTTGIYRAWFSMGDRIAAGQLAAMLLGFVALALLLERTGRRRASFTDSGAGHHTAICFELRGLRAWAAVLACALPIVLGFVLPGWLLLKLFASEGLASLGTQFTELALNSLLLGLATAFIAVTLGLFMVYGAHRSTYAVPRTANRLAALGYAIPGPVIAVGTLVPLATFDNALDAWLRASFGISSGLLLTGSIAALIYAYLVRFMTVSIGGIEAGFTKLKPNLDDAASALGAPGLERLFRVHVPLLWPALATAGLMVFVDVMKELPATLVLRPFDFNTLAVRTFNLARDERLSEAAGPALALVAVGLLPVLVLSRSIMRTGRKA